MDQYIVISPRESKLLKALHGILEQPEPSRSIRKVLARKMGISEETVKTYLEKLSEKFAIEKGIRGEQRYRKIIYVYQVNKEFQKAIKSPQISPENTPIKSPEIT